MTTKRRRGRKWAMLEAVATALLHGWRIVYMDSWAAVLVAPRGVVRVLVSAKRGLEVIQ